MRFAVVAAVLLFHREKYTAALYELVTISSQAEVLERVARQFLAARDLSNTPLQTLELGIDLLEQLRVSGTVPDRLLLRRLQRAVRNLENLFELLSQHENEIDWGRQADSFDPRKLISEARHRHPRSSTR